MRKGYRHVYKHLILYIVLSFVDNKYFVNCQKIKNKIKFHEDSSSSEFPCQQNGDRIAGNVSTDSSYALCNYTSMGNKSDDDDEKSSRRVTCYTCVNVSDNRVCNKYAIDKPCRKGNDFCHTLHIMDPSGKSILVNKKCANETECTPHSIGCYKIDNQKICISCCDENYCNRKVPTQRSNATFKNSRTLRENLMKSIREDKTGERKNRGKNEDDDESERNVAVDRNPGFVSRLADSIVFFSFHFVLAIRH